MREIKFRGFGISDKRWHYGFLTIYESGKCIVGGFEVYPESVGQHTGLHDKNGKEIYEGDIIKTKYFIGQVTWVTSTAEFSLSVKREKNKFIPENHTLLQADRYCEVAGNIYENPELLGEEK